MITRSTVKETLALDAKILPDPATNTTAVWIKVYREFIPRRQGVTMGLTSTNR